MAEMEDVEVEREEKEEESSTHDEEGTKGHPMAKRPRTRGGRKKKAKVATRKKKCLIFFVSNYAVSWAYPGMSPDQLKLVLDAFYGS